MDIVIGLIGAKGAGKTTAFETIKDVIKVQEITLAGKLKDVCAELFKIDRNKFDSQKLKEKELDDPVFLTLGAINYIFGAYGYSYLEYDKYVRPHVGKVLHTPREIAQYIGTEVLRNYNPDVHCEFAAKVITERVGVVTDMRFPNEYDYFAKHYPKFYPVYIQNIGAEVAASRDLHASESHLKDLSRRAIKILGNNGSVNDFQNSVKEFVREIV